MKVLQVVHGWQPRGGGGGAERAASALTTALDRRADVQASLIACVAPGQLGSSERLAVDDASSTRLIASHTDWIFFSWQDARMAEHWRDVLRQFQPDVVHLHHYSQVGIELPMVVKEELPATRVVLTLHEFLAMCPRSGQLVQRGGQLCDGPGVRKCSDCMEWPIALTAAKDHYIRSGLSYVDAFTSPSNFLAEKYEAWGLTPRSLRVIPNVLDMTESAGTTGRVDDGIMRIGYLGQHTPTKGVGVLLDAVNFLPKTIRRGCSFEIYGGGAHRFGEEFEKSLLEHNALRHREVSMRGEYANDSVSKILDHLDLVVVPSTWWENSPVVIEEALSRGVPVLCSNVGGMAEKVQPGVDGWHFLVGDARSLAERLIDLYTNRPWTAGQSMRRPPNAEATTDAYVELYQEIRSLG